MRILFDAQMPLGGVGLTPWAVIGPETWFANYTIFAGQGWNMPDSPRVIEVDPTVRNANMLVVSPAFAAAVRTVRPPYTLITRQPVAAPQPLAVSGYKIVPMNTVTATDAFASKVAIRRELADVLPFAAFDIYIRSSLQPALSDYNRVAKGRSVFVLQDDALAGGRGTFIVRDFNEYCIALKTLEQTSESSEVVVSDFIEDARERSVQSVLTQHGVFIGPLQTQLLRQPLLCDLNTLGSEVFCGGQISHVDPLQYVYPQIEQLAQKTGAYFYGKGYRGILGLDFLVAPNGKIYFLEANPRVTGLTPLNTRMWSGEADIPLSLLHILERCGITYSVNDPTTHLSTSASVLVFHSLAQDRVKVSVRSGIYKWNPFNRSVQFVGPGFAMPKNNNQFLLEMYNPASQEYLPARRLAKVYIPQIALDDSDRLTLANQDLVRGVRALFQEVQTVVTAT